MNLNTIFLEGVMLLFVMERNSKEMNSVIEIISSVEHWFNRKFGWFFTNGNKS